MRLSTILELAERQRLLGLHLEASGSGQDKEDSQNGYCFCIFYLCHAISSGVISIVLGYRLFCRGVWPSSNTSQGTDVEANVAGSRFKLKNAAPGTCFALFGGVIICIMFAKGSPELTLETLNKAGSCD